LIRAADPGDQPLIDGLSEIVGALLADSTDGGRDCETRRSDDSATQSFCRFRFGFGADIGKAE